MAFIKVPEETGLEPMYLNTDSIDILGYPRLSSEGFYYTFTLMVNGARMEPRFKTEEDCIKFHDQLKAAVGAP